MKDLCKSCGVCCKFIPVNWEEKIVYRDGEQKFEDDFEECLIPITESELKETNPEYIKKIQNTFPNTEFFSCKYLSDKNICTKAQRPEVCENFPSHPFSCISEDCHYYGDIFIKQESLKQRIRRLKEEIIDYKAQISVTTSKSEREHLQKIIIHHQKYIGKYKNFGSKNW